MQFNEFVDRVKSLMGIEESYAKTMRTLRGIEPTIKNIAIISPENPCGKNVSPEENNKRSKEFTSRLRNEAFSYRKIRGKYGEKENSYIINDITKSDAIQLGREFRQDTIIFGFKSPGKNGMTFQMITSYKCSDDSNIGEVVAERNVFKTLDKDTENFYSEIKGRKFFIPFFDDEYKDSDWLGGYTTKKDLPESEKLKLLRLIDESLDEGKNAKYRLVRRGMIKKILETDFSEL